MHPVLMELIKLPDIYEIGSQLSGSFKVIISTDLGSPLCPGFSTFDTNRYDIIKKDKLELCFAEFEPYLGKCGFPDCAHISEKKCAVREAVEKGAIAESRYRSYCEMYEEAKQIKDWEINKQ